MTPNVTMKRQQQRRKKSLECPCGGAGKTEVGGREMGGAKRKELDLTSGRCLLAPCEELTRREARDKWERVQEKLGRFGSLTSQHLPGIGYLPSAWGSDEQWGHGEGRHHQAAKGLARAWDNLGPPN
jgi:hypothetical protein